MSKICDGVYGANPAFHLRLPGMDPADDCTINRRPADGGLHLRSEKRAGGGSGAFEKPFWSHAEKYLHANDCFPGVGGNLDAITGIGKK